MGDDLQLDATAARRTDDLSTAQSVWLARLAIAYGAASLFHHVHNAVFLSAYPNLPPSLTPARVMAAWLAQMVAGLVAYVLVRRGWLRSGLVLLAIFGALGYLGLLHYHLAAPGAHSGGMNASIGLEVAAGTALLVFAVTALIRVAPCRPIAGA